MHSKFESQFSSMALEVEKRDALIAHLQSKVRTLELSALSTSRRKQHREKTSGKICSAAKEVDEENDANAEDDCSSGSSAELLFMVMFCSHAAAWSTMGRNPNSSLNIFSAAIPWTQCSLPPHLRNPNATILVRRTPVGIVKISPTTTVHMLKQAMVARRKTAKARPQIKSNWLLTWRAI